MVKVGKEFGGDIDPDDPDIAFRKHRWTYWEALKEIRAEYATTISPNESLFDPYKFSEYIESKYGINKFSEYIESKYGIKMHTSHDNITDKYDIVDEQKYLIFLLKWK